MGESSIEEDETYNKLITEFRGLNFFDFKKFCNQISPENKDIISMSGCGGVDFSSKWLADPNYIISIVENNNSKFIYAGYCKDTNANKFCDTAHNIASLISTANYFLAYLFAESTRAASVRGEDVMPIYALWPSNEPHTQIIDGIPTPNATHKLALEGYKITLGLELFVKFHV